MTIDEVYRFVKTMANKENRGWIKPSEFNLLAERAQLDLIKDRVGTVSPDGVVNGYKTNAQFWDELRPVIAYNVPLANDGDGDFNTNQNETVATGDDVDVFGATGDYLYFLSARYNGKPVDMVDMNEIWRRRESYLNPPSEDFPVGIVTPQGIRVFITTADIGGSEDIGVLRLTYIKKPPTPNWAYNTVNNVEIYNSTNSTQLTLPETTHKEIAHRILAYIGVTLREQTIVEYGTVTVAEQNK